ncbi:Catsper1 [Symbiodinium sp. CCMP2456]|nr:Catsper1 [Symbiodinium sp. CCMP2456]
MAIVVLTNSVVIGASTAEGHGHGGMAVQGLELELKDVAPAVFSITNNGFLLIYMCEIFLRFLARGLPAIKDPLTCLDIALVLLTFVERMAAGASMARSLPSIRLLRLLRLIRAFKSMSKSKELIVLLGGTSKAARTLLWTILFLFSIVWTAGACTRQVIGRSPVWNGSTNPLQEFEPFSSFDNREYFGNIWMSFLTMFQVVTNAQWADHVGRPVVFKYPGLAVFFAFFLLMTTFGLVTCIVSNIVQDSLESSRAFEKALKEIERENRRLSGLRARRLLLLIDEDGDGELSLRDLEKALENEEFVEILRLLEVRLGRGQACSDRSLDREPTDLEEWTMQTVVARFNTEREGESRGERYLEGSKLFVSFMFRPGALARVVEADGNAGTALQFLGGHGNRLAPTAAQQHKSSVQFSFSCIRIEECFNCLALFIDSRENTELYYRALRAIRSAPPPVPVDIRVALGLETKKEKLTENEEEALMNFARRYIAPKQHAKKKVLQDDSDGSPRSPSPHSSWHSGLRVAATLTCHKAVLAEPPPPREVDIARQRQEQKQAAEMDMQYTISRENAFRSAQKFSALKDLLGGL